VMSAEVQATTLRQLLTMDAGLAVPESGAGAQGATQSKDWVREILANPAGPPGQGFEYSNDTSHLLAAIVAQATGISPLEYARERLFGPLGIDTTPAWSEELSRGNVGEYERADFAWPTDPQGINIGSGAIKLRPRDMVKLGQLFLDGGRWEGKQIVPVEWVDAATTRQIEADDFGWGDFDYGYQWWTGDLDGDRAFQAWGYGGQAIVVVPSRDLVMAVTTELRANDATSHGIDLGVLQVIVEDGVVSQFPPTN
jgi:CubicO group peptidase (beta-lactamase class C family)